MGFVVIRCLTDGEPVYTGLQMEPEAYESSVLATTGCSAFAAARPTFGPRRTAGSRSFAIT